MMNWLEFAWAQGIPCVFHWLTGLYCPGCGGTRAVKAFLRGDFISSFYFHPLILYVAVIFLLEVGSFVLSKILKNSKLHIRHYDLFIYLGIALLLVNCVYKNYMLMIKGIDLLQ